jgi:hypothetical protein
MSIYITIQKVYTERMKYKVRHKEEVLLKLSCTLRMRNKRAINSALCFYADEHIGLLPKTHSQSDINKVTENLLLNGSCISKLSINKYKGGM